MWSHEQYMKLALEQARLAYQKEEVPVGAVLVASDGTILAESHNQVMTLNDPTAHAEIQVIKQACQQVNNYRLNDCFLYVTLEPCTMCLGAIFQTRLAYLVYGANEPKTGACGSIVNLGGNSHINHHTRVISGVLKQDCSQILTDFFKLRRQRKHGEKLR
ncbi:tRNA adenosine(34) deaminase TadA [Basilea psittacipulmonis]|uniref:tRNA-specific adenosine deaminase n=1 Tax=Basilea psittacipulmonis DSM 24701 TaxID=1072685 RepID=A0A077DDA0_9BURK|nr:tRNA adenosine(34) deaminase TadA [Basilea psittacipulmonis]AIL32815.1 hypothetical protein IX83_05350 [Basilea psittacipulmonis DSM 24701]